jgi:hypothetical protein
MGIKHQGHPKYYFLHYNKLIINVNLWGLKNLRKSGESCANELLKIEGVKVSVVALGFAVV